MALTGRDTLKRLQAVISASDVSQDLSDITVPIVLATNNRPNSVDDDFTGADGDLPNNLLWEITDNTTNNGSVLIIDNSLRIDIPNTSADESLIVGSKFKLSGNIDIQVDFNCISYNTPSSSISYPLMFRVYNDSGNHVTIGNRLHSSDPFKIAAWGTSTSTEQSSDQIDISKFRITRDGSVIKVFYWKNSQWEWDGNTSGLTLNDTFTDEVAVFFSCIGDYDSGVTVDIDNFLVNTGTIIWSDNITNGSGKTTFDASLLFEELSGKEDWKYISFEYGDTGQQCFAELEVWEPENKKAVFHVNIPNISSLANTKLFLYYGKDFIDNTKVQNKYQTYLNTELSCKDISDDFTGSDGDSPNTDLWITLRDLWAAGYTCVSGEIESNKLKIADSSAFIGGIQSLFYIYGDFDIQSDCDFTNLDDWSYIYAWNSSADRAYIGFNSGQYVRIGSIVSSVSNYTNTGAVQPTSIRMVRKGSVITGYYSTGAGWVEIDSLSCHTEGFFIAIVTQTSTTNKGAYYDNFIVNSAYKIVNYAPIKDEFSGTNGDSPDNTLWDVYNNTASGTVDIQSNKLHINIPVSANDESISLVSKNILPNSSYFDIKIDFSSLVSTQPTSSYSYPIQLRLTDIITGVNGFVCIQHAYNNSTRRYYYDGALWNSSNLIGINDTSGKLRLVKSGSTITFYYWNNSLSRWEWNGNVAGSSTTLQSTNDLEFRLHFTADFGGGTVIDVDDFIEISYDPIFSAGPFSDNFANGNLWIGEDNNWKLWFPAWPWDSSYSIVSNELLITPSTTSDIGGVTSRGKLLSGDFHVKVDAEPINSGGGAYFHLVIDNENRCYVGYNQGTGKWECSYIVSNSATVTESSQTGIAKKTLEIIRSGSNLAIICADEIIVTATFVTGDCYVGFGANYYQSKFSAFEVLFGSVFTYPSIIDDFTGTDGDLPRKDLWNLGWDENDANNTQDGNIELSNNKLNITIGNQVISFPTIISKFAILGDFDVQVDFICNIPLDTDITGQAFGIYVSNNGLAKFASDTFFISQYSNDSIGPYRAGVIGDNDTGGSYHSSGKFRIVRNGTTLTGYYYESGEWIAFSTKTLNALDVYVHLFCRQWGGISTSMNVDFDNFIINYAEGITGYIGETGSVPAQMAWKPDTAFASLMAQDPSGTAPQILDSTTNESHGTSYGTMTSGDLIDGTTGKLIEFDGTDDYINYGYKATHDITDELTIEAVIEPSTLLDTNLTDTIGIVSRLYDPTDNEDTYILVINSDGKLHLGSAGGSLQSTKDSFSADTKFLIVGTYNSSGLVGDLFIYDLDSKTGGKETLSVNSLDSMVGSTNNLVIGKSADTGQFFPGSIGFVRISNEVKSDAEIEINSKAWMDDLFTIGEYTPIIFSYFSLSYDLEFVKLLQNWESTWFIAQPPNSTFWECTWGIKLFSLFSLVYSDQELKKKYFSLPYKDTYSPTKYFSLPYSDTKQLYRIFDMTWDLYLSRRISFSMGYSICQDTINRYFGMQYDISEREKVLKKFQELWHLVEDSTIVTNNTISVILKKPQVYDPSVITDVSLDFKDIKIDGDTDSYVISCDLQLGSEADYISCELESDIEITIAGTTFKFFVETMKSSISNNEVTSYYVSLLSPAAKLDSPYSLTLVDSLENGIMAKELVETMAAIKGISVDYQVLDWWLPAYAISINDETPIEVIRKVVNSIGAIVQSKPNGDLLIISEYPVSPPDFESSTPDSTLSVGDDIISLTSESEIRDGFNAFLITDQGSSEEIITIEEENINKNTKIIKGFRVPFADGPFDLETSGGSAVTIQKATNYISEIIPVVESAGDSEWEVIEFIDWVGKTQYPIYSIVDMDWIEDDLGAIQISEDGTLTVINQSNVPSESLLRIKYKTQYWKWTVTGPINKEVQFYVPEIEE